MALGKPQFERLAKALRKARSRAAQRGHACECAALIIDGIEQDMIRLCVEDAGRRFNVEQFRVAAQPALDYRSDGGHLPKYLAGKRKARARHVAL